MKIKKNEFLNQVKKDGVETTRARLLEALEENAVKPEDISIKQLVEAFVTDKKGQPIGRDLMNEWDEGTKSIRLTEAGANFVDTGNFAVIFNQYIYNALIPSYTDEAFAVANSFGVIQTSFQNGELIPGISNLGDCGQRIGPGQEFPLAAPTQDYLRTRPLEKYGFRVAIEWESAIHDNSGLLLERCRALGFNLGLSREKQACDVLIDSATAEKNGNNFRWQAADYRYNWKDKTYATYQGSTPWINSTGSNTLVDYNNLNSLWLLLANITDPFTGEPLRTPAGPAKLFVTQDQYFVAQHIVRTTQIRTNIGAPTSVSPLSLDQWNGLIMPVEVVMSKYLKARLTADSARAATEYYMGFPSEAFKWMSYSDVVVEEEAVPGMQGTSFSHHLLTQYRCYRYQAPIVFQPRMIVKSTI